MSQKFKPKEEKQYIIVDAIDAMTATELNNYIYNVLNNDVKDMEVYEVKPVKLKVSIALDE